MAQYSKTFRERCFSYATQRQAYSFKMNHAAVLILSLSLSLSLAANRTKIKIVY